MRRRAALAVSFAAAFARAASARAAPCHVFADTPPPVRGALDFLEIHAARASCAEPSDEDAAFVQRVVAQDLPEAGEAALFLVPAGVRAPAARFGTRAEQPTLDERLIPPLTGSQVPDRIDRPGDAFFDRTEEYDIYTVFSWPTVKIEERPGLRFGMRGAALDAFGLPRDEGRRIEIGAGPGIALDDTGPPAPALWLGGRIDLPAIAADRGHGDALRWIPPGTPSTLSGEAVIDRGRVSDLRFFARLGLGGLQRSWPGVSGDGVPRGRDVYAGMASALDYSMHVSSTASVDQLAALDVLGPVVEASAWAGPARVRGAAEAYGSFATVQSPAVLAFIASRAPGARETRLSQRTYYIAFGASARVRASVEVEGVEIGGALSANGFSSIADPFHTWKSPYAVLIAPADLRRDVEPRATDARLETRVWLSQTLSGGHLRITWVDVDHRVLAGRVDGVRARDSDTRIVARLSVVF